LSPPRSTIAVRRGASRVEAEQRSQVLAAGSQFLHVVMARAFDAVDGRTSERRAVLFEKVDDTGHRVVVVVVQRLEPLRA
jgi:hypothetical protein